MDFNPHALVYRDLQFISSLKHERDLMEVLLDEVYPEIFFTTLLETLNYDPVLISDDRVLAMQAQYGVRIPEFSFN